MLIAEDLLLLATDDTTGKLTLDAGQVDVALGGANLVELAAMNKVDLTREGDDGKVGRLVVRDPTPPGDPVLDAALSTLTGLQGKKPSAAITPLSKKLRDALYDRLVEKGILRSEQGKILGIFPTRSWPAEDADHEREVRRLITQTLVQGATPDVRTAALVSLLHALKAEHKIVDPKQHRTTRKQLQARAKEIAEGSWGSAAVRRAVDEMMAAVTVATMVATTAAIGAGGAG